MDDHALFRRGLRALLECEPGLEIVGEARNGREAVKMAVEHAPDLVIMDLSMPDMNGVDATRSVRAAMPEARVLCLSMHAEQDFVSAALDAGASGYALKDCDADELLRAVRSLLGGHAYLGRRIADHVLEGFRERGALEPASVYSLLSQREREVLQLISEGHCTRTIGEELFISPKTVARHREHVMEKLGAHSVAELTKVAIREGLTSLN